jgi:ankyrin repeat protein
MVKRLLQCKGAQGAIAVQADQARNDGWTPLLVAAEGGFTEVVDALLRHGASVVRVTKKEGADALQVAAREGHLDVVKILLKSGSKIGPGNVNYSRPLSAEAGLKPATRPGIGVLAWLTNRLNPCHNSTDLCSSGGTTALHLAARNGHLSVVLSLIKAKSNLDPQLTEDRKEGCKGTTPLMFAARLGHETVVRELVALGAKVGDRDGEGGRDCKGARALQYALAHHDLNTLNQRRLNCANVLAEEEATRRRARGETCDAQKVLEEICTVLAEDSKFAPLPHAFRRGSSKHHNLLSG